MQLFQTLTIVVLLVALIAIIALRYRDRKPNGAKQSSCLDHGEVKRLEKALSSWVKEKRYRDYSATREEIASELHTSKEFLYLYFKWILKLDFNTWRTRLRVEDAQKLLMENRELPINMVAEMVGFSDRSNFHRQFTKIVGCTPKQWREKQ